MVFVFLWPTSLSMTISKSVHVAGNSIISFLWVSSILIYNISFFFFLFLWLHLRYMKDPSLEVKSEPQLPSYAIETWVRAASVTCTSEGSNAKSLTPCVRPGINPKSSRILIRFLTHWTTIIILYHIFSIHLSVNAHLDCVHVSVTVNSANVNIGVHESFQIMVFSAYMPRSGIAGSYGNSIFRFLGGASILFSIMTAPTYIPNKSVEGFPFLHTIPSICHW